MAEGTCSVDGCGGEVEKRGWCGKHYRRWQRTGSPIKVCDSCGTDDQAAFPYHGYTCKACAQAAWNKLPRGLCQCGCGEPTRLSPRTLKRAGIKRGEPFRFLPGHENRGRKRIPEPTVEDRGFKTPCHIWRGARDKDGYGAGRPHRRVYQEAGGVLSVDQHLDHLCRQRDCVNPAHLEPVTPAENVRRSSLPNLNREQVGQIKRLALDGWRGLDIADAFGVHGSTISRIHTGRRWSDVPPDPTPTF